MSDEKKETSVKGFLGGVDIIEHSAICDVCDFPIVGTRYKCANCHDFDLCQDCEGKFEELSAHERRHVFLKISTPLRDSERRVRTVLPNLYTGALDWSAPHCDGDSERLVGTWKPAPPSNPNDELTVVHESILCSECSHPIIGARFFCIECAHDVNLCEQCEQMHPTAHTLLKIRFSLPSERRDLRTRHLRDIFFNVTFSDGDNPPPSSSRAAHTIINSSNLSKYPGETFILRQSVRVDGETLHDIDRACFKTPYSLKFFINFPYREKYQFIEVCELSGDRIAGYVAFRARPENCTMEIVSLAVSPEYRQFGIARRLMSRVLWYADKISFVECIWLHVSVFNFPAQNLYKSFGFVPHSWIKGYYEDENEDALYLYLKYDRSSRK